METKEKQVLTDREIEEQREKARKEGRRMDENPRPWPVDPRIDRRRTR